MHYGNRIIQAVADEGLDMLGIDRAGLTELDRRILACLAQHRRAVGLKTIAVTIGEEEATIEDIYEPYLIQCGYLTKTPTGRVLSLKGYQHLGVAPPTLPTVEDGRQERLF